MPSALFVVSSFVVLKEKAVLAGLSWMDGEAPFPASLPTFLATPGDRKSRATAGTI